MHGWAVRSDCKHQFSMRCAWRLGGEHGRRWRGCGRTLRLAWMNGCGAARRGEAKQRHFEIREKWSESSPKPKPRVRVVVAMHGLVDPEAAAELLERGRVLALGAEHKPDAGERR